MVIKDDWAEVREEYYVTCLCYKLYVNPSLEERVFMN